MRMRPTAPMRTAAKTKTKRRRHAHAELVAAEPHRNESRTTMETHAIISKKTSSNVD